MQYVQGGDGKFPSEFSLVTNTCFLPPLFSDASVPIIMVSIWTCLQLYWKKKIRLIWKKFPYISNNPSIANYPSCCDCSLPFRWDEPTHWKRPWCWERRKAGGEGDGRGWDGWMASLTQWTEQTPGARGGQGSLACCSPWGHRESEQVNDRKSCQ